MAQSSHSTATGTATPSRGQTSPPISSILPLLAPLFSAGLSALSHVLWLFNTIFLSLLSPFLVIIPIIIYLFSPIIVSSQILLDLFIVLPYRVASYSSQALYPIYAFLGVACLSGAILGFGGRQIVSLVGWGLLGESQNTRRSGSPSRARPQPQRRPSVSVSARGKRKVSVKMED
ncbi:hypothetical protein BJV74DRAFT_833302 [Russula compacta]|nr:hypothetical protein BJV74DRAFT_833302 [Russula compacta]